MVKKIFINNNTFAGYLHSRGVLQHFHLDLQDNMRIFQPPRWCDMALPSWALTFPMLDSLQYPKPFSIPSLQVLITLTSRWRRILTWAYVDNMPIEPWHFLIVFQSSLNSSLTTHRCCSEWKNSSPMLGIQFLEESQLRLNKSLKWRSPLLTYEV